MGDHFIFSTEDGTIAGWQSGTAAVIRAANATAMAKYKGLGARAPQQHPQAVRDRLPTTPASTCTTPRTARFTTTGGFTDPNLPAGYAPFGVLADGSTILVTFAKQDADAKDDVHGPGLGYVDVFDFDGVL